MVIEITRYRKTDRRSEQPDDLRMEIVAAGQEMTALGRRIQLAIHADRPDIADQVAARLITLGGQYRRTGGSNEPA